MFFVFLQLGLFLAIMFFPQKVYAATYSCTTSTAGSWNWTTTANWATCNSTYPGGTADTYNVTINNNATAPTIAVNTTVNLNGGALTLAPAAIASTITLNVNNPLTAGVVTLSAGTIDSAAALVAIGTSSLTATSVALTGGSTSGTGRTDIMTISTGSLTVSSGMTFSTTNGQLTTTGAATINLTGTIGAGGTLSINSATTLVSTGTSTISGAYTFGKLSIPSGTLTLGAVAITFAGTTSVTGTLTTTSATGLKTFSGQVTVNSGGVFDLLTGSNYATTTSFAAGIVMSGTTFRSGSGALAFSATQAISGGSMSLGAVTIASGTVLTNNDTGTVTMVSLAIASPTVANGISLSTGSTTSVTGAISFTANATANNQTLTMNGTANISSATLTINAPTSTGSSLITCAASATGTLSTTGAMTISGNSTSTGAVTLSMGTCTLLSGGLLTINGGTNATGVSTVSSSTGVITALAGVTFGSTVADTRFTTTGAGTVNLTGTMSGAGVLSINSATTLVITGTAAITTTASTWGNLTISSGTLSLGASAITFAGSTSISGTLASTSATGAKTFTGPVTVNSGGYFNLSAYATITNFAGGITVNTGATGFNSGSGLATFTANQSLAGSVNMTFGGAVTINNGVTLTNSNTATVTITGTLTVTTTTGTLTNSNTISASGAVTDNGVVNNNGTFTVVGALSGTGSWTQGTNSTLNAQGGTTTANTVTTFSATATGNTVNYNDAAATGSQTCAITSYYNLGFGGSGATANTKTCALTTSQTVLNITVSGTASWTLTTAFTIFGNLTMSGGILTTGGVSLNVNGTTTISGGTLTNTNNTGAKRYAGLVTVNGGTLNGASTNIIFWGGITQTSGTVSITGTATFTSYDQTLSGILSIATITTPIVLTNNGILTVNTALSGTGTFTQGASSTLILGGTYGISTLNVSATGNIVRFTQNTGITIPIKSYYNLELKPSGATSQILGAGTYATSGYLTIGDGTNAGATASASNPTINIGTDFSISAGATFVATSGTITIGGSYSNSGTFTNNSGTVNMTSGGSSTLSGTMTGASAFYHLTFNNSGGSWAFSNDATVNGNFTITAATNVTAPSGALSVVGNFSNSATFTANSGTVSLTGGNQTISGSTTFYNLTKSVTTAYTLTFTLSTTQIITNTITLNGTAGNLLTLASSSPGTQWIFDPRGTRNISYASVSWSNNINAIVIAAVGNNITDGGMNTNWNFDPTPPNSPTILIQQKLDTTIIATGGWTNSTSVQFTAAVSDPDPTDTLYLCVEAELLGVSFTNTQTACGGSFAYSGTPVPATVNLTGLSDTNQYHWQARVRDHGGNYSAWVSYGANLETDPDLGVDTTVPTALSVYDGTTTGTDSIFNDGSLSALSANWGSLNANVSGLLQYEYSIGTTVGGTNTMTWTNAGTSTSVTSSGLSLQSSQVYYFNIRVTDNAGNTAIFSSDGQRILPSLSFSISSNSIVFNNLNNGNSFSDTQNTTLTTTTNAYNGYLIRLFKTDALRSTVYPSITIGDFNGGTYASPGTWGSGNYGFGYTSNDTTIQGVNIFNAATCPGGGAPPCYAPFSSTAPGDIVADHTTTVTGSPISAEQFTITYKIKTPVTQAPGAYTTNLVYTIIPQY